MQEIRKEIEGYEGLYEITKTGRIISVRNQRAMVRCKDEYGFHIVKLTNNNGESKNCNLFKLWKVAFSDSENSEFMGSLKPKYGTGCKLL